MEDSEINPSEYKRCTQCNRILPCTREYFYRRFNREIVQFRQPCKQCSNDYKQAWKRNQKEKSTQEETIHHPRIFVEPGTMKHCSGCNRDLAATYEHFYHASSRPDGFQTQCRMCQKKSRRIYPYQSLPVPSKSSEQATLQDPPFKDNAVTEMAKRCDACHKKSEVYYRDTDFQTKQYCGYLCSSCHWMVTGFHQDYGRMRQIVAYLKKTRTSYH